MSRPTPLRQLIVELLEANGSMTVTQLVEATGRRQPTVHRCLATAEYRGIVVRMKSDPDGRRGWTPALWMVVEHDEGQIIPNEFEARRRRQHPDRLDTAALIDLRVLPQSVATRGNRDTETPV